MCISSVGLLPQCGGEVCVPLEMLMERKLLVWSSMLHKSMDRGLKKRSPWHSSLAVWHETNNFALEYNIFEEPTDEYRIVD
jgi:hypothetical protein